MLIYNTEMISVYDANGNKVNEIDVGEETQLLHYDRVSKGERYWYKGAGIIYDTHHLPRPQVTAEYENINAGENWYVGNLVKKKCFVGKQGIFMERYQAQFDDFIGSCGVKELSILENSEYFLCSDVQVVKAHLWDKENKQYWFKLDYISNRIKYVERPAPGYLWDLVSYMIQNDWNFIWDKNSINDVSYLGTVTDVADIFKSRELSHKLGTVYSILYSLNHHSPMLMQDFLVNCCHLNHFDSRDFINNSIAILLRFGIDIGELKDMSYEDIVLDYLITGRNCGDCSDVGMGDSIRDAYLKQTTKLFKRRNK